jgi:hypothetical protein
LIIPPLLRRRSANNKMLRAGSCMAVRFIAPFLLAGPVAARYGWRSDFEFARLERTNVSRLLSCALLPDRALASVLHWEGIGASRAGREPQPCHPISTHLRTKRGQ